jgi:hypothetical protein
MAFGGAEGSVRYLIALAVAAVLIAAGALYVWLTFRSFDDQIRQSLRRQQQAGTLPPEFQGIDIDTANIRDIQIQVTRGQEARMQAAFLLSDFWYVWAPLAVAVCLGVATLIGQRSG